MNKDVRRITDGAMMCAIVGVMLLLNRFTGGFLTEIVLLLLPQPMVFYSAKYGAKNSWAVFIAMCLLGFFISGGIQALFYVGTSALIGLVYGSGVETKSPGRLLISVMIIAVISDVLSMLVFTSFFGYDLTAEVNEMSTMMNQLFEQTGTSYGMQVDMESYIRTIIVVSTVLTGVLEGLVTHLLSRVLLGRFHYQMQPMKPFREWFPPKWSGYLGLAGVVMYYYSVLYPIENTMLQNVMQGFGMCGVIYLFVFGVACVLLTVSLRAPKMKPLAIILILFFSLSMMLMFLILGFFYIVTNMHRQILEGVDHAEEN